MFELKPTEVYVWPMRLDVRAGAASRMAELLSADERERAARFRFVAHGEAYVVARASLRTLLGKYLGRRPETIAFAYGPNGKPRLAQAESLHFNVSHSHDLAAFAFADRELGIDVEAIRAVAEADGIASRYFSGEECADLRSLLPQARDAAFFHCWTRKEAFVKATGMGLSIPLDRFRVTLRPDEDARIVHIGHDEAEARRWTLHDLALESGYAAAVAYRDARRTLVLREPLSLSEPSANRGSGSSAANCDPTS